jgi:hypothetical protein
MPHVYPHLGVYGDWVQAAREPQPLFPEAGPGRDTQQRVCPGRPSAGIRRTVLSGAA